MLSSEISSGTSGHVIRRSTMFSKIAIGVSSLNGGTPVSISNRITPTAHQSTRESCGPDRIISGAR